MEEVLLKHKDIVEAAVVAMKEDLKGEIPIGLVVIKQGHVIDAKIVEKELIALIRSEIGPVASFQHALVVERLPKTRSGKVLRGTLKKIVDGEEYKVAISI
jgi:propionyl-CoA synthetase